MKYVKFITILLPVYFAISYMSVSEDTLMNVGMICLYAVSGLLSIAPLLLIGRIKTGLWFWQEQTNRVSTMNNV